MDLTLYLLATEPDPRLARVEGLTALAKKPLPAFVFGVTLNVTVYLIKPDGTYHADSAGASLTRRLVIGPRGGPAVAVSTGFSLISNGSTCQLVLNTAELAVLLGNGGGPLALEFSTTTAGGAKSTWASLTTAVVDAVSDPTGSPSVLASYYTAEEVDAFLAAIFSPPAGGATGQSLVKASNADGDFTWSTPAGTGDVVGPAGAVADRIAVMNGTSGKAIADGGKTIAGVLAEAAADATTKANAAAAASQPLDATLTALAALTTSADRLIYATGSDAFALTALTAAARGLLDDATVGDMRTTLEVLSASQIAATYQPLDSDLTAIAALTTAAFGRNLLTLADADSLRTTAGLVPGTDVQAYDADLAAIAALTTTAHGRGFLELADAAASRTYLGLGTAAVLAAGSAGGVATLDGGGKVPTSQLPDTVLGQLEYQGTWAASTNTPTLADPPAASTKGHYYVASDGGTFAGITFATGDWIVSNGSAWEKVDNTDAVATVFGRTGNIAAVAGDYSASLITFTPAGSLAATDVQAALQELDTEKQPLATALTQISSGTWAGAASITTLGTIGTGTWQAGVIAGAYGGTGVANTGKTITLGGNLATSGAFALTLTLTAATDVTLPTTGTLATLAGSETFSNKTLSSPVLTGTLTGSGTIGGATVINTSAAITGGAISGTTGTFSSTVATTNGGGTGFSTQSAAADYSIVRIGTDTGNGYSFFASQKSGTGTELPISFRIGSNEYGRVTTTGFQGVIGATTPAAGSFTTLGASGAVTLANVTQITASGSAPASGSGIELRGTATPSLTFYNRTGSAYLPAVYDGLSHAFQASGATVASVTSTGLAVTGTLGATGTVTAITVGNAGTAAFNSSFVGSTHNGLSLCDSSDTSGAGFGAFKKASGSTIGSISRVGATDAIAFNTTSAREMKENIEDMRTWANPMDLVNRIPIRVWDWRAFGRKDRPDDLANCGVIYDEVYPVFPDACTPGRPGKDKYGAPLHPDSVDYSKFVPLCLAGLQDHDAELKSLRARVKELEAKLAA